MLDASASCGATFAGVFLGFVGFLVALILADTAGFFGFLALFVRVDLFFPGFSSSSSVSMSTSGASAFTSLHISAFVSSDNVLHHADAILCRTSSTSAHSMAVPAEQVSDYDRRDYYPTTALDSCASRVLGRRAHLQSA